VRKCLPFQACCRACQVRKRVECRTRELHQSLLVKLAGAVARAGEGGALAAPGRPAEVAAGAPRSAPAEVRFIRKSWRARQEDCGHQQRRILMSWPQQRAHLCCFGVHQQTRSRLLQAPAGPRASDRASRGARGAGGAGGRLADMLRSSLRRGTVPRQGCDACGHALPSAGAAAGEAGEGGWRGHGRAGSWSGSEEGPRSGAGAGGGGLPPGRRLLRRPLSWERRARTEPPRREAGPPRAHPAPSGAGGAAAAAAGARQGGGPARGAGHLGVGPAAALAAAELLLAEAERADDEPVQARLLQAAAAVCCSAVAGALRLGSRALHAPGCDPCGCPLAGAFTTCTLEQSSVRLFTETWFDRVGGLGLPGVHQPARRCSRASEQH